MSADKRSPVLPRLRFPEFVSEHPWNDMALSTTSDINPTHNGLPESFIYIDLESVNSGTLVERKEIERDNAPSRAQRLLRRKDILYQTVRPYQRNNLFFDIDDGYDYVASTGYAQLRAHGCPKFLYQLLHTNSFVNRVLSKCTGSNYPAINSSDLVDICVSLPKPAEQQKIADCLGSLDDLIAAADQKLAALRQHKQGLMQQLFPQPGETVPRLRFPEFQNAMEWQRCVIGEIAEISKGKGISKSDVVEDGRTPCIRYGELYTSYGEVIEIVKSRTNLAASDLVLSKAGDVIIPASGETQDDIATCACVVDDGIALGSDLNILRSPVDGRFFSYYLSGPQRRELAKIAQGDTVAHLYPTQLSRLVVYIPDAKAEQQRIADCLSSLDVQITAQFERLEYLKTHKKGLLQQLFPSAGESAP